MNKTLTITDTAYTVDQLEQTLPDAPQIAMAGRSNVGKSSLINCLAGAKSLAKISSTPGKTRSINFFAVRPGGYYLTDLPGYGYARCSKAERAKWATLIEGYLSKAQGLCAVAVLLDARLDPQRLDLEMVSYVRHLGLPLIAVLTKADKVKQKDQAKRTSQWREILRQNHPPLLFSSKTGRGRDKLWTLFDESAKAASAEG